METGFYELTLKGGEYKKPVTSIVFLRRFGDSLEFYNLATKEKLQSRIVKSKDVGHLVKSKTSSAAFKVNGQDKKLPALLIFFSAEGHGLYALGLNETQQFEVTVANLPSVWACDNHDKPTHTAKTEDEIKDLIARHGCSLWHKLKESDLK
jgi:hypothetical protein